MAQLVKNPPAMQETPVQFLDQEDPLEKGTATHSSILAWRIPWTIPWGHKELDMNEMFRKTSKLLNYHFYLTRETLVKENSCSYWREEGTAVSLL